MGLFTIISSPFPLGVAGDVAEVHGGKAFADVGLTVAPESHGSKHNRTPKE